MTISPILIRGPILSLSLEIEDLANRVVNDIRKGRRRTNGDRAAEGALLAKTLICLGGDDDPETAAQDAITQLMHYMRLNGGNVDARLKSARMNFEAEVEEDPD